MIKEAASKFKLRVQDRVVAYSRLFDKQNTHANYILKDLAKFCRAFESTFHPDPRLHAMLEGRREVWLRITEHLELSVEELYKLHAIKEIPVRGTSGDERRD